MARGVDAAAHRHTAGAAAAGWLTSKASVGASVAAAQTPIALEEGASETHKAEEKAPVEMAWSGAIAIEQHGTARSAASAKGAHAPPYRQHGTGWATRVRTPGMQAPGVGWLALLRCFLNLF